MTDVLILALKKQVRKHLSYVKRSNGCLERTLATRHAFHSSISFGQRLEVTANAITAACVKSRVVKRRFKRYQIQGDHKKGGRNAVVCNLSYVKNSHVLGEARGCETRFVMFLKVQQDISCTLLLQGVNIPS